MSTKVKTELLTDIGIKRVITAAGRIQEAIAPQVKELKELNARIKHELLQRLNLPADTLNMVSGEYIAAMTAEKKGRDVNVAVRHIIMEDQGLPKFLEMVTIPMATLKKAYTEDELEALAPAEYTGAGRAYKLSKRT